MTARFCSLFLLATLLAVPAIAKDKKKSTLPDFVLRATTVLVVVSPDAGEPVDQPMANSTARDNVEKALMEWGRLHPVLDGQEPDLVIAVRTGSGKMVQPTIRADRLIIARAWRRARIAAFGSADNGVLRLRSPTQG